MFILIYIEHRNPETQKTFFDIRREAQSFYANFSVYPPPSRAAPVAHKFVWPRPGLNLN